MLDIDTLSIHFCRPTNRYTMRTMVSVCVLCWARVFCMGMCYTDFCRHGSVSMYLYAQAGIKEIWCFLLLKGQPVWSLHWLMENWMSGSLLLHNERWVHTPETALAIQVKIVFFFAGTQDVGRDLKLSTRSKNNYNLNKYPELGLNTQYMEWGLTA